MGYIAAAGGFVKVFANLSPLRGASVPNENEKPGDPSAGGIDQGLELQIEETERMLLNTRRFIDQLSTDETASRLHLKEVLASLEHQIDRLRAKLKDLDDDRT